jgi:SAM-dependent methyltransferase
MHRKRIVEQVLSDYSRLEPGQSDSWNPIGSKFELGYRLNLFYALTRALQHIEAPLDDLRILDLGCGNGRSARMYLDLGVRPDQLTGLDFREGAIALARQLNPAIRWEPYDGGDLPSGHNWVSATAVFSSIATHESRQDIVAQIRESLPTGGYMFYYDFRRANPFAGGDPIGPRRLFADLNLIWSQRLGRFSALPMRDRLHGLLAGRLAGDHMTVSLREMVSDMLAPSHEVLLLRKT